jgi:1,5-anhydro-D-fructose reductase (1,5-anhydro-D-mannitol-forming)
MFDVSRRSQSPRRAFDGDATVGWGLVGASAIAATHALRAIRTQPPVAGADDQSAIDSNRIPHGSNNSNGRIIGLFSHSETRARRFADDHAVPLVFVNLADLLAHPAVHCVYIANHPRHHAQTVLAALAAGKHVLCEPPLALELAEAQSITHTALSHSLVLAVNYVRRADPAVRAMRALLADRAIGDLLGGRISNSALLRTSMQTWRLRTGGGGVVLDRLAYSADLLRYLVRDEITAVQSASTQQILGNQVEEDVVSHVTLRRGGVFQLHDSFILPHTPSSVELYGSTGVLVARHCLVDDWPSELWLLRHGQTTPVPLVQTDPYSDSFHLFLNAIRTQAAPLATGSDGVQSLAVAWAAQESLRRGHRVAVPVQLHPPIDRSVQ